MLPSPKNTMCDVENIEPRKKTNETNSWANENPYIKRPMNAYMLWCRYQKPAVIKSRPDLKPLEINKLLAAEWKLLTTEEKKPFTDEAFKLKVQYYDTCKQQRKFKVDNKSSEPEDVPHCLSPTSDTETRMSKTVSTSAKRKKSIDSKVCIYLSILSSPQKTTPHITNLGSAGSQSLNSVTACNTQSKADVPYDHKFTYTGQKMNPGDYEHSFTRSLSCPQHSSTEFQQYDEESPLDLSAKKNL